MIALTFKRFFPLWQIPNIRRFYLLTICNNGWFLAANWIFYWLRFMNYQQLGVMDAVCFLFGLIVEVPSGAVADVIGKRRTIIAGMFMAALGFFLMGAAAGLGFLWAGFLLAQAGWAFYSGAAEALAYDSLVDNKQEAVFDDVVSTSASLATITTVLATLTGGLLYEWHYRSTHLGMAAFLAIGWVVAIGLREPKTDTQKFSLIAWWQTLQEGMSQLVVPNLRPFVVVMVLLMGAEYMYEWGLLRPAIATGFGFDAQAQAVLFAAFGILNALLVRAVPWLRQRLSDILGLYGLTVLMGVGFGLATFPLGWGGVVPMVLIAVSGNLVYPWIAVVVNKTIQAKYRATTLSTITLLTKIPYVLVAMVAGAMIETGQLWLFNAFVSGVILLGMVVSGAVRWQKI